MIHDDHNPESLKVGLKALQSVCRWSGDKVGVWGWWRIVPVMISHDTSTWELFMNRDQRQAAGGQPSTSHLLTIYNRYLILKLCPKSWVSNNAGSCSRQKHDFLDLTEICNLFLGSKLDRHIERLWPLTEMSQFFGFWGTWIYFLNFFTINH